MLQSYARSYVYSFDGLRLSLSEYLPRAQNTSKLPFLLVHGFAQNGQAFAEGLLPQMLHQAGYRVFLGELRGHGFSEGPKEGSYQWTIEALKNDFLSLLQRVLEKTEASQAHLMAHSLGGMLAVMLTAEAPQLVRSLITLATPFQLGRGYPLVRVAASVVKPWVGLLNRRGVPVHLLLKLLAPLLAGAGPQSLSELLQRLTGLSNAHLADKKAMQRVLERGNLESAPVFDALLSMAVRQSSVLAGIDLEMALRSALCPVALVVGQRDGFAREASIKSLRVGPHAGSRRFVELEAGGHVDLSMGRPVSEAVKTLLPFIEELDRA